jgi:hypothetical protein
MALGDATAPWARPRVTLDAASNLATQARVTYSGREDT